jgi:hypothetical protein
VKILDTFDNQAAINRPPKSVLGGFALERSDSIEHFALAQLASMGFSDVP